MKIGRSLPETLRRVVAYFEKSRVSNDRTGGCRNRHLTSGFSRV